MKSEIESVKSVVSGYGVPAAKIIGVSGVVILLLGSESAGIVATGLAGGLGLSLIAVAILVGHFGMVLSHVRDCDRCGIEHTDAYRYCPQCGEKHVGE